MFAPFSARALRATILAAIATTGVVMTAPSAVAATPLLTKLPINLSTQSSLSQDNPRTAKAQIGATTYFGARNGANAQLWKTDGTPAGTELVKDLLPTVSGGSVRSVQAVGSRLVVTTQRRDETNGRDISELWLSDGTAAGTVKAPTPAGGPFSYTNASVVAGGKYYLEAAQSGASRLWVVDLSTGVTSLADTRSSTYAEESPVVVDGTVYYVRTVEDADYATLATLGADGSLSDALDSVGGTIEVGSDGIAVGGNDRVYFQAPTGKLFAAAGPDADPELVELSGAPARLNGNIRNAVAIPNGIAVLGQNWPTTLYAVAATTATAESLPGSSDVANDSPQLLGTRLYVEVYDYDTDLRSVATRDLADPEMSAVHDADGYKPEPRSALATLDGSDYLLGTTASDTQALYRIAAGGLASIVKEFATNEQLSSLSTASGKLLLTVDTPAQGAEPWVSDGTTAGTRLLKDVNVELQASWPDKSVDFAGKAWLQATDGVHGSELWGTDGTPAGTQMLADLLPGAGASYPEPRLAAGGKLYFTARPGGEDQRLFVTDGTAAGTRQLFSEPGIKGNDASNVVALGSAVYFTAATEMGQPALWTTDGTVSGTVQVDLPIPVDTERNRLSAPVVVGGKLFVATTATPGAHLQLWVIENGSAPKEVLNTSTLAYLPYGKLFPFAGGVAFGAAPANQPAQFWKSDGTAAGTKRVGTAEADGLAGGEDLELVPLGGNAIVGTGNRRVSILRPDGTVTPIAIPDDGRVGTSPVALGDDAALMVATQCPASPTPSPTATPGATPAPTPGVTPAPTPSPTAAPTPTPAPDPTPLPAGRKGANCFDVAYRVAPDGTLTDLGRFTSGSTQQQQLAVGQGTGYFGGNAGEGFQLFETDGTAAGTRPPFSQTPEPYPSEVSTRFLGSLGTTRLFGMADFGAPQLYALSVAPTPSPSPTSAPTPESTPVPVPTPTPAPPKPAAAKKLQPIDLRTEVEKTGRNRYTVSGIVALASQPTGTMCDSSVQLVVKVNHKSALTKTAQLHKRKGRKGCTFSTPVVLPASIAGSRRVRVSFAGSAALLPIEGRSTALPR